VTTPRVFGPISCKFPIRNLHNRPPAPPPSARIDPDHFPSLPYHTHSLPTESHHLPPPPARIPLVSRPFSCEFPIRNLHIRPPEPPPSVRITPDRSQPFPHHSHDLPTESQHLPPPFAQIPTPFSVNFPGKPIRKSRGDTASRPYHHRLPTVPPTRPAILVTFGLGRHRRVTSPTTTASLLGRLVSPGTVPR